MDYSRYLKVLENNYKVGISLINNKKEKLFISEKINRDQLLKIKNLVNNAENLKSIIAVLITSLIKKIVDPNQDIRLHREQFPGGYSGRSLDTNVVTPWLKQHYPRFAPKESGWLTRSIEQPHPFTKDFPGRIRNPIVKESFLSILDNVQNNRLDPSHCLICILVLLQEKTMRERNLLEILNSSSPKKELTINLITKILKEHFSLQKSSRLPVIAIYSIYQCIFFRIQLYKDKLLKSLDSHTASDRFKGFGDIEIFDKNGDPFEVIEIKHNIPIDKQMIYDALEKIKRSKIKRFFILTTAEPNIIEDEEVLKLIENIKDKFGIEIVPNGVIPTIKYYLRFIDNPSEFLNNYIDNIKKEFTSGTDVKENHIKGLHDLIDKYKIINSY